MENRIPLPTDNIYKFYALFGLLLFVFSIGSVIYINSSTNDFIFKTHVELATLNQIGPLTTADAAKKVDLQRLLEVAIGNREGFQWALGGLIGIGLILMWFGFKKWQKEVQPIQDEMAKLELEKLKLEVEQMRKRSSDISNTSAENVEDDNGS